MARILHKSPMRSNSGRTRVGSPRTQMCSPSWRTLHARSVRSPDEATSAPGLLQRADFFLQQCADAMTRQVHLPDVDPQSLGYFLCRPFLAHIAIENLKLFRLDLLFHAR